MTKFHSYFWLNSIVCKYHSKIWFFEKINKIKKPLANMTKMRRKRPKEVKSETEKGR
jgi:hypothetical protein